MIEGPYKLPDGWRWVRLGEVCELLIGRTPRKEEYLNENTGTKVLKFRDIMDDGTISWNNHVAGYVRSEFAGRIAEIGDVILTAAAHTPEQIGRKVAYLAAIPEEIPKVYFTAELMVLRADKNLLDGRWLTFWLQSEEGYNQIRAHVKEKHLVKTRAKEISLPLPPLDEQRRIVARIEELMARVREAKRLRQQAKGDAERLMQAALAEVFPSPGAEPPPGWRWVRLGEVCLPTERRDPTKDPSAPFIYVDISAVDNAEGKIVSPRELLGQDAPSRARKVIRSGDVIFATTRPYLKNVAIVGPELDGQICSTGFCVLRANRRVVEPGFLFYLCRSDLVVAQLSGNNMRGASYPAVTDRDVYEALIPLPPLDEQRRIVAHLEAVQDKVKALKEAQATTEAELQRLEQAILDKAFRGEL